MYYLHQLDGSRFHRDTLIQISQDSAPPRVPHTIGNSPLINEAGIPQFFDNGWTLGPIPGETEATTLAAIISRHYNFGVSTDADAETAAAIILGRRGGQSTSEAKSAAARENGKRGGRHLASYYIRIDSYWQNSGNYFVGPFASRDEAWSEIDRSVSDSESLTTLADRMAQDVKNGVRIHGVLSKTEAKRFDLREVVGPDGWNLVGKRIPTTAHEMWRSVEM